MAGVASALSELSKLNQTLGPEGVDVLRQLVASVYQDLGQQVTRVDLAELRAVVAELAEAQRDTQSQLDKLVRVVEGVQQEAGGLARNADVVLGDRAYLSLPLILRERTGLEVVGSLSRTYLDVEGRMNEVDIWGLGRRNGEDVRILGEAKTQLSAKHIEAWAKKLQRLDPLITETARCVVVVTSAVEPWLSDEARRRGWIVVLSSELESARDRQLVSSLKAALAS